MKTIISSKGQIVLSAELRHKDDLEVGQVFEIKRVERGKYLLTRLAPPPNQGVIDWLLACPGKDFYVPVDSESTDSL